MGYDQQKFFQHENDYINGVPTELNGVILLFIP